MKAWIIDLNDHTVHAEIEGSENYVIETGIALLKNIDDSALTFEESLIKTGPYSVGSFDITTDTDFFKEAEK